jgi:uncharacterized membrane protein YiaA
MVHRPPHFPAAALVGAARALLLISTTTYLAGLWAASMSPMAKGFYLAILMYGLLATVSVRRLVREHRAGRTPDPGYEALCWISLLLSMLLLAVGLWNAGFSLSEKSFYGMAYMLSLLALLAV